MFGVAMNPERPAAATLTVCGGQARTEPLNTELVVRALNYHGQQLTSFLKESAVYESLDLRNVDYHLYHQRSRELRMEDRGKRLLLHRFISQKAERLFKQPSESGKAGGRGEVRDQVEEHAALLPPLEVFADINEDDRCRHFFEVIAPGDTILGRVVSMSTSGLMLSVLCMDPSTGKSRHIEDAKIRCFCPAAECVPPDPKNSGASYSGGELVRVVVLEVKVESQRLLAGMHITSLPPLKRNLARLGIVSATDLPAPYTFAAQAMAKKIPYSNFLERSIGFSNPTNVTHLASELDLPLGGSSLLADLHGSFPPEMMVKSIRKEQASKWAFKHVAQGIKYFKSGNNVEAFQCLNQALNIDAENVEGLVARGALFANNGGLEKAVIDFENALRINPTHRNAKKYMCETLIAVARNYEDEDKVTEAIETYERILRVVPDHKEAVDSLLFLRGKPKDAPLRDDLAGKVREVDKNKPRLRLNSVTEMKEKSKEGRSEKKKKKKRRRTSSNSSSSASSDSDISRTSSRKSSRKKKKKAKTGSPSLSPFSTKLAPSNTSSAPTTIVLDTPPADPQALPDLRDSLDKKREGISSSLAAPDGFPMIDLTKPPPGYPPIQPAYTQHDKEYDDKVARFLQETAGAGKDRRRRVSSRSGDGRRRSRSRRRSKSRERRSKSGRGRKSRSRERTKEKKSRTRERSKERKSRSIERRSRSRSGGGRSKDRRSESRERKSSERTKKRRGSSSEVESKIVDGGKDLLNDDEFAKRLDDQLRKSEEAEAGGWRQVSSSRVKIAESGVRGEKEKHSQANNVFSSEDEMEENTKKKKSKRPSEGGMWVPTGSDSILEGVKEAKTKLADKATAGRREEEHRRRKTELPPPPAPDYVVTFDSRTGMYIRVPKPGTQVEEGTMAERIAMAKVPKMDEKEVEAEMVERIVRKTDSSPPRMPKARSRSRERRRSRSRGRRSRSRGRRSRSRGGRRSRSRSRGRRRSKSRERRGKEKTLDRQSSNPQLNSLQKEVSDMKNEARRLQKEREAIEKEKAQVLEEEKQRASAKSKSSVAVRDEFSGMETVMKSVMEAVGGKSSRRVSPLAKPSKIIPGAQTFEDLEAFLKRKKDAKLEELKKKK